jgi:hypothetical protein
MPVCFIIFIYTGANCYVVGRLVEPLRSTSEGSLKIVEHSVKLSTKVDDDVTIRLKDRVQHFTLVPVGDKPTEGVTTAIRNVLVLGLIKVDRVFLHPELSSCANSTSSEDGFEPVGLLVVDDPWRGYILCSLPVNSGWICL